MFLFFNLLLIIPIGLIIYSFSRIKWLNSELEGWKLQLQSLKCRVDAIKAEGPFTAKRKRSPTINSDSSIYERELTKDKRNGIH